MNDSVEVGYGYLTLRVPAILANAWEHVLRERAEQPRVERLTLAIQHATDEGLLADASDFATTLRCVLDRIEPASAFLADPERCRAATIALNLVVSYLWEHADEIAHGEPSLNALAGWAAELGNWFCAHRHPAYDDLWFAARVARARYSGPYAARHRQVLRGWPRRERGGHARRDRSLGEAHRDRMLVG